MRILVTGYTGQLGYDVVNEGKKRGLEMIGIGREELDITKEYDVANCIASLKPDSIIHCAAYTAVDKAEEEKELCWQVNVNGTKYLAEAAKLSGAKFMLISTDYVFKGEGTSPLTERAPIDPVNYYGYTKCQAEKIVRSMLNNSFIIRISWVFGINGSNFVKTMLRIADSSDQVNIVGDQYGSPTYTLDLARLLIDIIQTEKYGTYHATNEGFCSWAEFAEEIFKQAGKSVKVNAISTEDYPTKATRPKNSRMSKQKIRDCGFKPLRTWKEAVSYFIKNELSK